MGAWWLTSTSATTQLWKLSRKCIKSRLLVKKMMIGTYVGQMGLSNVTASIGWNLIRESTIFQVWISLVAKISSREICSGCRKNFQRNTTFFHRLGSYLQNMLILESSLKICQKIKRRLLLLSQKPHVRAVEYFWQETLKIWILLTTLWCRDTYISLSWLMSSSSIYVYMYWYLVSILSESTSTKKAFADSAQ
jgi:hypothetical protein